MTENVAKNFQQWVGDAVSVAFAMSNVNVLNAADLAVYLDDTPQTIATDYSVSIAAQIATVTFLAAPAAGVRVTIVREEPLAQNTDLTTINTFRAEGFEGALDTIVRQIYRIWHKLTRALTLPDSALDDSGQFDARSNRIGNVADPTAAQDAVTKTYADASYIASGASVGDMLKSAYDSNADGKVNAADAADVAPWTGLTGVPASFPPSVHTHTASDVTDFASAADARMTASAQSTGVWEAGVGTAESAVSPAKVAAAVAALASGGGDMLTVTYDPTSVAGNAFAMDNMVEGATTRILTAAERTKLTGIETGATADQTGAQIKAAYEAEANAFTDVQFTKLAGIETAATADQTGAEIKASYEAEANAFTDAQFTKLSGVASGATANSSDAALVARANHTGTQAASTVSDFSTAADARITTAVGVSVQAYDADTAKTDIAQTYSALQSSSVETLTDGVTITPTGTKNAMQVTLGGNRTIANMTTITAGAAYLFELKQDATGGRTAAWGTAYQFAGGTAPTLSTAANAVDVISGFSFDGTTIRMFAPGQGYS
uniref:phage tail fiber domain-containing protein n=1 Tax=Pararhizobium sp. IMCC3301 TaxID=3067904 RepID=UPI0027403A71|nr:phage tail fiber protein [Pararhizobium sp. IMCC3301]